MIAIYAAALAGVFALITPAAAQEKLVAIDVLLEPDEKMLAEAGKWNEQLRGQLAEGFSLDETHRPHITLLQQYVAEDDLDEALAAVQSLATSEDLSGMRLKATGLYHIPSGETGLQGITIEPSKEIVSLQEKVIEVMAPFRGSGGSEAAFVPDPTGTPFDPYLFEYVDTFAEKQTGDSFNPHVTTGVGPLHWVKARETEPFEHFEFGVTNLTVYRLGNFGTAAEPLEGRQ